MVDECCDSVGGWDCSRKVSCNLQDCECSQQNKSGEQLELWGLSGHIVTRGAFDVWIIPEKGKSQGLRTIAVTKRSHALIVSVKIGGYSVWKLDTPLSAKCLCTHWGSFIVNDLLISELCVTFVRMERWQICDRKEMEIVSGFGSAGVEGRGAQLCINGIDNQLARSESMQNSKTQRGNKHLCESSWTN